MFDKKIFGARLTALRENARLTQQALGDKTDVTKATISRIESGDRAPSIEVFSALVEYFGVPASFLLNQPPFDTWEQVPRDLAIVFMIRELPFTFEQLRAVSLPEFITLYGALFARVERTEKGDFKFYPRFTDEDLRRE